MVEIDALHAPVETGALALVQARLNRMRETGGNAIDPHTFSQIQGSAAPDLRKGPQAILLEYAFLDSSSDMAYWRSNYPELIAAAYRGSMIYWQIFDPDTQNSSR